MQITFIAYGTRGDAQPALALGRALRARGHSVRMLASPHFKDWIQGYGLTAVPAKVDVQALMTGDLGNEWAEIGNQPLKQMRLIWGKRVQRLGVGPRPIPRPKLTVNSLSAAIWAAVTDAGMRRRAADLSELIQGEDGVSAAVKLIEAA